ncbi:MAG: mechanosensitive ion channel [Saprospiraceae bacterium]|nr:mechanosensitive ion channel [Saprospiraceae bacterium]
MNWIFLQQSSLANLQERLPFINDLLTNGLFFVARLLGALLVVFIGRLIAKSMGRALTKLFKKIGVDTLADRLGQIDLFQKSRIKITPSEAIGKALYYIIFFIFVWVATDMLRIEALSDMISKIFDYLPVLTSALVVFIAGIFLADFLKNIVLTATKSLNIPAANLIANLVFYFLFINVAMITLAQAGIRTESIEDNISIILAGVVAAFAIGYGYASRPVLSNMLAAYYNRNRIQVGDQITIEGVEGKVVKLNNTSITLETDDKLVVFPLNKLITERYELRK